VRRIGDGVARSASVPKLRAMARRSLAIIAFQHRTMYPIPEAEKYGAYVGAAAGAGAGWGWGDPSASPAAAHPLLA